MVGLYFHPCGILRWTPSVKCFHVGLDVFGAFSHSLGYNLTHDVIAIHLDESRAQLLYPLLRVGVQATPSVPKASPLIYSLLEPPAMTDGSFSGLQIIFL